MATMLRQESPGSFAVGLALGRSPIISGVARVMPTPDSASAIETARVLEAMRLRRQVPKAAPDKIDVLV